MKKWMAFLLALMMALAPVALAEQDGELDSETNLRISLGGRTKQQAYEELIVGSTTELAGRFFSDMWGENTADMDVRTLLHGYSPVRWQAEKGIYTTEPRVVSGLVSVAKDGKKQYVVALHSDLCYSDGSPITARDYVFSLLLSASPEIGQIGGAISKNDYITGMTEYAAGASQVLSGVRLLGDYQFSIEVNETHATYFYEMSMLDIHPYPISEIAPGCEVADDGEGAYIRNADSSVKQPIFTAELLQSTILDPHTGYMSHPAVTSGPYMLTAYDADQHIATFALNPNYLGDDSGKKPTIQRLVYKLVRTENMVEELKNGKVDLLNKCTMKDAIDAGLGAMSTDAIAVQNYMRSGLSLISFNCERGPAQFQRVRQAIAKCMDRDRFIREYVGDYGVRVDGYYGLGQWMYQLIGGETPLPEGEDVARWKRLSMDVLDKYAFDLDAARQLLVDDGWTLNEQGGEFVQGTDSVRAKRVDGEPMPLRMTLIAPEGNSAVRLLDELRQNLAAVGGALEIVTMPFSEELELYYRQKPRDNDMFYLATNFESVFDPTHKYSTEDKDQGVQNTSGLRDEALMELAEALRNTAPGQLLEYCEKWIAFQQRWNALLPEIPLYSNVYYDFNTTRLRDYVVNTHLTWPQALQHAYLSDAMRIDDGTGKLNTGFGQGE